MTILEIAFIILIFIVFYTYIGYGIVLGILVKLKRKKDETTQDVQLPEVTLFITAYNEEDVVQDKMKNCHELDYPENKIKIVWVTDGSNDKTNKLLDHYKDVEVYYEPARRGKTAAMNRGMKYVTTPIVIFTDANTYINRNAIKEIVLCFNNNKVGCVAGEKRIADNNKNVASSGEGAYWKYESTLKKWDYELYSAVGAAGELFAIRTNLFNEMPEDTLLDDFILSMKIVQKGYVIAYCDKAYAIEGGSANMKEEEKRKVRIAAGGLQSIYRLRSLLNIFKYKTFSFQYISHRVLRWSITPICLFILIPVNLFLMTNAEISQKYNIIFLCQILFYTFGFIGYYLSKKNVNNKLFYIPYYFLFMNFNVIKGFFYMIKKKRNDGTWEKSKRA